MATNYQKIIILTAPSGAGKTSITHHLMQEFPQLSFSVSATTRKPRGSEKEGEDYYFISDDVFKEKIKEKEFAEWEMVYEGKYYGTLKTEMERIWSLRKVPVLDIDVKGAIHVQDQYPINTLTIFVEPPTLDALHARLISRGTESPDSLDARLSKSAYELSFKSHFDKSIVNDHLPTACAEAAELVRHFLSPDIDENIPNH